MAVIKSPVETQLYPALLARMARHLEPRLRNRNVPDDVLDDYAAAVALSSTDLAFDPKRAARAIDSIVTEAADCPEPLHCLEQIVDEHRSRFARLAETSGRYAATIGRLRVENRRIARAGMAASVTLLIVGVLIGRWVS